MNCELIYQRILEKTNKNLNNGSISLDRARAVTLFNEEQNKFIEWVLQNRSTSDVKAVQALLTNKKLGEYEVEDTFTSYKLPSNYFDFSNIKVKASSNGCSDTILPIEVKSEDLEEFLNDSNNEPSFIYRETLYTVMDNTVKVFKKGFKIDSVELIYYRYPRQFNLEGYINELGQSSYNSEPEFDDKIINRIISMVATSFDINNENLNKVQIDMARVAQKY